MIRPVLLLSASLCISFKILALEQQNNHNQRLERAKNRQELVVARARDVKDCNYATQAEIDLERANPNELKAQRFYTNNCDLPEYIPLALQIILEG